ncbi:MAG: tetratricopeptide repeat protein, partial [Pseudomonadota bacterium]
MRSSVFLLGIFFVAQGALAAEPAELLLARGIQSYQNGFFAEAEILLRRSLEQNINTTAASHYLGLSLVKLGKLEDGRRVLAKAAKMDKKNPRLLLDLGLAYLAERNIAWAVRVLNKAKRLAPQNGQIAYFLGVALLKMGEAKGAIEQFEKAKKLGGVDAKELQLQLGLANFMIKQWEESRDHLSNILIGENGDVARRLVRAAYEAEGFPSSLYSVDLSTGVQVDTNPLYEHETTSPTALGPSFSGAVVLRPWVDPRNLIWGQVSGSRVFYFAAKESQTQQDVTDASRSEVRALASYTRRIPLEKNAFQLSAGYSFGLTFLDGGPPLADPNHIFVERHGGHASLQWFSGTGFVTQLRYGLTREVFADLPRSNWGNGLSLESSFSSQRENLRLLGWLSFRHEAAQSNDYDAVIPGAGLGASFLGSLELVLGVRVSYEHENHFRSESGRGGKLRRDDG